jgi:MYXO-CTERM domain-containing protein
MWLVLFAVLSGRQVVVDDNITTSARAQSRTIYLNKNGVTLTPGSNDSRLNRSSIIASQVTVPPWNVSSQVWTQTVTCLRETFAPFDVQLTETDPGDLPHIEAVFGGSPSSLAMPGNYSGVSPFSATCKVIENSVVFTFTDVIPQNAKVACEIMAQEIAHSYGLDHQLLAADPMSYLSFSGAKRFQNVMAECGESTARPCAAPGGPMCRDKQNSYALLMERIGAAGTGDIDPPAVAITFPADGAEVDPGFTINVTATDDVKVRLAVLSIDGQSLESLTGAPWSFTAPLDMQPGRHVIEVMATDGAHEQVASIEVTIRGEDGEDFPIAGCSTGGGTGWLFGLLVVGLVVIQRRAQR